MTYVELQIYLETQIKNYLCFEINTVPYISLALERTSMCLRPSQNKYALNYSDGEIPFSVYNSVQYCIFLYYISRVSYEVDGNGKNAEKFYYLNKIINSVDLFYAIELPQIWGAEHPLGSVMGRASYSDFFFFYQGCTVGGNKAKYPISGKYVVMYSNSKVLGDSQIGNNVIISANTYIKDEKIQDNAIVFGQSPNLIIKPKPECEIRNMISHIWHI